MERWRGKTALVTGASTGIGYSLAIALARLGMKVIWCARHIEIIQRIGIDKDNIQAIRCDLSKEEDIKRMFEEIEEKYTAIHVLVNNAGIVTHDDLLTGSAEKWHGMIDLNVTALSVCSRETLRLMEKNGITDGHIINVNSMLGHEVLSISSMHFYSATKHMVKALTDALVMELLEKNSSIRVTSLSPGAVDTDVTKNWLKKESAGLANNFFPSFQLLQTKDLVDAVVYVLSAPPHVTIRELMVAPTKQPTF